VTAAEDVAVVPDETLAALDAAGASHPAALPGGADHAARVAWWMAHVDAEEARAAAYARLHRWAMDSRQPMAVVLAIGDARRYALEEARQSRCYAKNEPADTTPAQGT
jgi:hypothetical protein